MTFDELLKQLAAPARRALLAKDVTDLETLSRHDEAEIAKWHGIGKRAMEPIRCALRAGANDEPQRVEQIIRRVVDALRVGGVCGVVLGGSRARGTQVEGSDIDIGIYYDGALDDASMQAAASGLDDRHRENLISPPGGWGPWVNAGGWLVVDGMHVDLILRDIRRVEVVVGDCVSGDVSAHYQPGHPHAFINAMYLGEVAVCRVLYDPDGRIEDLKKQAHPYPPKMKNAMLNLFGFETGFSLELARRYAGSGDIYYVTAHLVRCVSALNQVLFARNGQYCINEKRAVAAIGGFPLAPVAYQSRVEAVFALLGHDAEKALDMLGALCEEAGIGAVSLESSGDVDADAGIRMAE